MGKWLGVAVAAVIVTIPPPVFAQVARPHLISQGNLILPVGNPAPIEKGTIRAYAGFFNGDGKLHYADDTDSDYAFSGYYGAADFLLDGTMLSAGYEWYEVKATTSIGGSNFVNKTEQSHPAFQLSLPWTDRGYVGIGVALINSKHSLSYQGASGSATHHYNDIQVGGTLPLGDALVLGAQLSPQVKSEADFGGDAQGVTSISGHGTEWTLGVGIKAAENLTAGVDLIYNQEYSGAFAPQEQGLSASAQWAATERFVIEPEVTYTEADKLSYQGETVDTKTRYLTFGGTVFYNARPDRDLILGLTILRAVAKGSDTGDASFDEERFDQSDLTLYQLSASMEF